MSDEGEEVRYSERDPARTRRGSDDRCGVEGGENVQFDDRERSKNLPPFFLFFLRLVGKSALFALVSKSSALFGVSFLSIIIRKSACVRKT